MEVVAAGLFGGKEDWTLGPPMMGAIFDAILWGVMLQQIQSWWAHSRATERLPTRYLTYYIMLGSTAWTAMSISYIMHNFVYMFGQYAVLLEMPYFTAFPITGWGLTAAVQAFYIDRSFRLNNRNIYLLLFLSACIVAECVAVILLLIKCTQSANLLAAPAALPQLRFWQIMTLATDLLITTSLGWGLWSAKTGWTHTDALVKKLLLVTLETQLAPTLIMIAFVVEMSITPSSTMGVFFDLLIPKAYTVGFLATLNVRVRLKRAQTSQAGGSNGNQTRSNAYHLGSGRLQQATVQVDTDTYIESYQMEAAKPGINRSNGRIDEEESVENLDYAHNLSKRDLNQKDHSF
ncbi:uncharacterized protein I303_105258 [Kwoniella dejecticola CBS 10117]|uniref:DUF6534 domain-containing protein n=1 Tax=Kwoniella dejecticola CBS 10117 TaxID=1296121 RepID=A0A1A6A2Z8_9TREE|nr:uncharacterized protein I303_05294 [Kwoniella dejecticola CBS 10117]OBR84436.1 hypothetical protein I303_05294 [Kwoniella dejecticola CBS 10117]